MIENIKAFAADIDMTLTSKGEDLPDITRKALQIMHKEGILLGLATGRVIEEKVKQSGQEWHLGFDFDFIIGLNGGMVYNSHTDTMWSTELMTIKEMKDILVYMMPMINKYKISVNAEGGGNHNAMNIQGELLESSRRHGFDFVDKTDDVDGFCERQAYKMLFRTEPEYAQEIRDTFFKKYAENYQMIETFPGTVEVMHKGIDKGSGLERYAKDAGIDMKDIIAFGDSENDNTLLEKAGWGVCLIDGGAGTKKFADDLTDTDCESGGVGHYLFEHYLIPKGMATKEDE